MKKQGKASRNISVRVDREARTATICAPPDAENMTDDEWLAALKAATKVGHHLESQGYKVNY